MYKDLLQNSGGIIAGTNSVNIYNINYGTIVADIINRDINNIKILSIILVVIFSTLLFID